MARKYNKRAITKTKEHWSPIGEWLNGSSRGKSAVAATAELLFSAEQVEFMMAMDGLKRRLRRMPTCGEVLMEAKRIGYRKGK